MADIFEFAPTKVEWNETHAAILRKLLDDFEEKKIRYVILKNDNGLPFQNKAKDVDIVIEPGKYSSAAGIITKVYKLYGIQYYKVHKFERLRCWYGFNIEKPLAIHIDLLEGFLHKGFELLPFDLIFQHAYKNQNGVYVLDEAFGNIILLLHSTICYHRIKEKYRLQIQYAYSRQRNEFIKIFERLFCKKACQKWISLLDKSDFDDIEQNGRWFSHQSKKRLILKRPLFTLWNVVDFLWEKLLRIGANVARYNIFISVQAPDGTGKTTFIKSFTERLGFFYVCDPSDLCKIYHFRPEIFPNLGAAGEKMGVMKQDKNFTIPHRAKSVGVISSFLRMSYYWLDYLIGIPVILRKNAQFNKITIFDRYIYDFLIDPRRSRINLPYWCRLLFVRTVKQPSIVFVLDAPAEIIYNRKQELTMAEIERQLSAFKKLSLLGTRYHQLDASKAPDEISNDAIKVFFDHFAVKL